MYGPCNYTSKLMGLFLSMEKMVGSKYDEGLASLKVHCGEVDFRRPDMEEKPKPDFRAGIALRDLPDGSIVAGRVDDEEAILVRRGDEFFAVGAHCTHYHGPLAEGLVVGDTVRCPWHHACFSLRTGEALRAPALDPIACWRVERVGDKVFVREKLSEPRPRSAAPQDQQGMPASVVIVGGGAAGLAAADMLRREGYDGVPSR